MVKALDEFFRLLAHAPTIRRLLRRIGLVWRRARPALHKREPRKAEELVPIAAAIETREAHTEVFLVDEADVDLNLRIGLQWTRRGHQPAIATPGRNRKVYLAGALHAHTGRLVWRGGERKNTALFIDLLEHLRRRCTCRTRSERGIPSDPVIGVVLAD